MDKPDGYTEEHAVFLEEIRVSGKMNMFGVAPILAQTFDISKREAREIASYWMFSTDAERYPSRGKDEG